MLPFNQSSRTGNRNSGWKRWHKLLLTVSEELNRLIWLVLHFWYYFLTDVLHMFCQGWENLFKSKWTKSEHPLYLGEHLQLSCQLIDVGSTFALRKRQTFFTKFYWAMEHQLHCDDFLAEQNSLNWISANKTMSLQCICKCISAAIYELSEQ